jgi:hypothetical protein
VAGPLAPEPFSDTLPAVAGPVDPVSPERVEPVVSALPDVAFDPEFEVVVTAPDWPPLPESPDVATGFDVALPVSVEPVEPVGPETLFDHPPVL